MRKRKNDRWNQFLEVIDQIHRISIEIRSAEYTPSKVAMDESDLSTRRLEELHRQLQSLQKEKVGTIYKVIVLFKVIISQSTVVAYSYSFITSKFPLLQTERLKQVMDHLNTLNSLCLVLGIDFRQTVHDVHPSLDETEGSKNISNDTIESLASAIQRLREVKIQRMQKVSDMVKSLFTIELFWLLRTPSCVSFKILQPLCWNCGI